MRALEGLREEFGQRLLQVPIEGPLPLETQLRETIIVLGNVLSVQLLELGFELRLKSLKERVSHLTRQRVCHEHGRHLLGLGIAKHRSDICLEIFQHILVGLGAFAYAVNYICELI